MSTTTENHATPRFTGFHMFACLAAFFCTVIAVNITMAVFAAGSWTGLIVKNSYVASQHFNTQLANAKVQTDAGIHSRLALSAGILSFTIKSADGTMLIPQRAIVWIGRPAFEQQDRTEMATCTKEGICTAPADLGSGPWALRIEAILPNATYRRDARIIVRADGSMEVD